MNVIRPSESRFLVNSTGKYNVDIDMLERSCGHWKDIGIPCRYGTAAFSFLKKEYALYFSLL